MSSGAGDPFPVTAAQLTGNFCETLFFGIYLVTCAFCARTLLLIGDGVEERWRRLHEIRWMMLTIAVILFIICTFDVAIGLLHNFHAFIESDNPTQVFGEISDWINVTRTGTNNFAMIIGDFVLIYRCWIVHGRRWLVIVPSIFLQLGSIIVGCVELQIEANPNTEDSITINSNKIRPLFLAFFAIAAVQNVYTTSMLVLRIWRVEKQSEKYMINSGSTVTRRPRHLRKVIRVIAESGAAYTVMVFISFIVGLSHSNAMYPTSDITLQATGIVFNVILVRSSTRRDQQFTVFDKNESTTILAHRTFGGSDVPRSKSGESKTHDVELAVRTVNSDFEQQSRESDSAGIKVSKAVITSDT